MLRGSVYCQQIPFAHKTKPLSNYIGFPWTGFGNGKAIGVVSVRSYWKLPPWLAEPMPGGFKMDMPLTKAGPIRNGGNTSVIIYLRRRKNQTRCCTDVIAASEEQDENM